MKNKFYLRLLCSVLFLIIMQITSAKVWYVGTWPGKPTGDVKTTLSEAYSAASAGDQIWMAAGEYTTPQLTVKNGVSIYGSFAGTETAIEDRVRTAGAKPWQFANPTVIKNSAAAVFVSTAANTTKTVFDGLTFDGENAEYRRAMNFTGARTNTNYVLSNSIVKNYKMNGDGGALNLRDRTEINNCLIINNISTAGGGAMYLDADCSIHHSEISNNESSWGGGGVSANGLSGGGVSVYNCLVANNKSATGSGGVNGNRAAIYNCLIINNTGGNAGGIGLDIRYASTVYNNTVVNNRSTGDDDPATGTVRSGGLAFYSNANATKAASKVYNTIFWNNRNKDNAVANLAKQNTIGDNNSSALAAGVYNCITDRTDYTGVTFTDCIAATDSTDIFGANYTLKAGSSAIDAGYIFTTMPETDFFDAARLIGNSVDIGMYEDQNGDPYVNPNIVIFDGMMEIIRNEKKRGINISQLATTVNAYVYNQSGVCNVAAGGNGFFPDIDYSDTQGNAYNWKSTQHLDRLINMALVYTVDGSPKQGDNALFAAIEAGTRAWTNSHPAACGNWWYNQIAEPQRLGTLLILMRKGATQLDKTATEVPVLARMYNKSQSGYPGTGNASTSSNITNVAEHCIYSALLSYDAGRLRSMLFDFVYPNVSISTGITADGIKPDQSHMMHSQVLYIGGYGEELIKNVTYFSVFTAGTEYAMPDEKTEIIGNFVRNTWLKSIRGQYMLWDVTGRGVSRIKELDKRGATIYLERMKAIDPDHSNEYDAGIKRLTGAESADYQIEPMSRQHFIADHTLHIRPEYTFDVNFVSTRTRRIEWGNGENKKALYMSDGCTNIVRRGDEYATIEGTWNWARIPGITCLQTPEQATINNGSTVSVTGTSNFAGGVTDSMYSVTAYYYPNTRVNLSAKKGWFMFDNEIVCLGNSITAAAGQEAFDTNTTLNQANLNGDIVVSENGTDFTTIATTGEHSYPTAPKWVLHDTIAYVFPDGGNAVVCNQTQSGNWYDINNNGENATVTRDVFSLWLNHGKSVNGGKYAYIIVPNKTAAEMQNYYAAGEVEILANSAAVQAVYHKTLRMYGIIFYSASATFTGGGISVNASRPCVMLIKDRTSHLELHVADPTQEQTSFSVRTKFPATETDWTTTVCDFTNTGDYRGASKAFVVSLSQTGMNEIDATDREIAHRYYDLTGREVLDPCAKGIYIVQKNYLSGKKVSSKMILH
jgi:chondroitin AC lyase